MVACASGIGPLWARNVDVAHGLCLRGGVAECTAWNKRGNSEASSQLFHARGGGAWIDGWLGQRKRPTQQRPLQGATLAQREDCVAASAKQGEKPTRGGWVAWALNRPAPLLGETKKKELKLKYLRRVFSIGGRSGAQSPLHTRWHRHARSRGGRRKESPRAWAHPGPWVPSRGARATGACFPLAPRSTSPNAVASSPPAYALRWESTQICLLTAAGFVALPSSVFFIFSPAALPLGRPARACKGVGARPCPRRGWWGRVAMASDLRPPLLPPKHPKSSSHHPTTCHATRTCHTNPPSLFYTHAQAHRTN